ncbi:MAG TPA: DUF5666 domain-containing protein [Chloroflexota bacterium]|nr:DUF5666 domain-containing protein [Chloroflexota bacterium]
MAVGLIVSACSSSSPAASPTSAPTAAATTAPTTAPTSAATSPTAAAVATSAASPTSATPPAAAATTSAQPAQNSGTRITGTIQSIAGDRITLTDGTSFTVPSTVRIINTVVGKVSDLQVGQYVAVTAKRQPDNTLLASIVNVFPPEMKGVGIGQRPMSGGDLMTNATIDSINGDSFTVTFPGGGAKVKLTPDAKIGLLKLVPLSDLSAGTTVSALVADGVARTLSVLPASTASQSSAAATSGASVMVTTDPKLGPILTASNGRTLYKFAKDQPNVSNCTGNCLGIWPPLTASGTPTLAEGVPGKLDVLVRPDGIHQVTYNGIPLYYYSKDTKPGDTNGQGVGGNWSVVAPSAAASANATAKSSN